MVIGRDAVAGAALIVLGAAYAGYAGATLPVGTLRQMGPGMFPVGLGVILAGLGLAVLAPALTRDVALPEFPLRSFGLALGAVATFALTIGRFGLVPAVMLTTVVAALAIRGARWQVIVPMAVLMVPLTWAVFNLALAIEIPLLRWRP